MKTGSLKIAAAEISKTAVPDSSTRPEDGKWPLKRQLSTISAIFKRKREKVAPRTCVCPRRSSSKWSKWWKLSRKVTDVPASVFAGSASASRTTIEVPMLCPTATVGSAMQYLSAGGESETEVAPHTHVNFWFYRSFVFPPSGGRPWDTQYAVRGKIEMGGEVGSYVCKRKVRVHRCNRFSLRARRGILNHRLFVHRLDILEQLGAAIGLPAVGLIAGPAAQPIPGHDPVPEGSPKSVTTSDSKHQSAPNRSQHRIPSTNRHPISMCTK